MNISTVKVPTKGSGSSKARAIAHVVSAIDSQTAIDHTNASPRAAGDLRTAKPCPNAEGGAGRQHAAELNRAEGLSVSDCEPRLEERHRPGKQHQQRDDVERPLQDDGGKRRGGIQADGPREPVRADHFADAPRQHRVGAKADDGGAQGRTERHRTSRQQQVLPAKRAKDEGPDRGEQRDDDAAGMGVRQLPRHGREIGLPQEEREKRYGDEQNTGVLDVARHAPLGCSGATVL